MDKIYDSSRENSQYRDFYSPGQVTPTTYHLRAYVDPSQENRPVFLVHQAAHNNGPSLDDVRGRLAEHLCSSLEKVGIKVNPSQVVWLEQGRDGSITRHEMAPHEREVPTRQSTRLADDLNRADLAEAMKYVPMTEKVVEYRSVAAETLTPERVQEFRQLTKDDLDLPRGQQQEKTQQQDWGSASFSRDLSQYRQEH